MHDFKGKRSVQSRRTRDSRMSEGEKEGPARQRRTARPRVVPGGPTGQGECGALALIVGCINYIGDSLGKVKKAHPHATV